MGLGDERKIIKHLKLDACDSTQNMLKLQEPLSPGILISSLRQTDGYGRNSKNWMTQHHSLCFSFSQECHPHLTWHSLQTSVHLCQWIKTTWNIQVGLKWPNDIFNLNFKKIGGVLHETKNNLMLIGVGLNLFPHSDDIYPSLLDHPINHNLHDLSHSFATYCLNNSPLPPSVIAESFKKNCIHLHRPVSISDQQQIFRGLFINLGSWGEAVIQNGPEERQFFNGTLELN